jgi:hypothetical protein
MNQKNLSIQIIRDLISKGIDRKMIIPIGGKILHELFLEGKWEIKSEKISDPSQYSRSLISNYLRKEKEFNDGIPYQDRKGKRDSISEEIDLSKYLKVG